MATTTKRSGDSSKQGQPSFVETESYDFAKENLPNADILVASLRSSGYSIETAINDLIDNSIDNQASSVVINIDRDKAANDWLIEVGDDGAGMGEPVLDQMMRLGSRTEHDIDSDLGKFGLGSNTASLALGRNKHVITASEGGPVLSSMWDLDVIEREKRFLKHLAEATSDEQELFASAYSQAGVPVPSTGTLVRVTKCDLIGRRDVDEVVAHIRTSVGQTFRRFLVPNGGLTIVVNGRPVTPIDPMMRDHKDTQILFDDEAEFSWKENGAERTEKIGVLVVHLPDFGGSDANQDAGIKIDSSGYYVLRNGREIAAGITFRLFARHNERSRFRCELSFPARMDDHVGVTFLKSSAEIKLSQALRDKIKEITNPYRRQSEAMYKKSRPRADEQVPHEEAAKQIKKRSNLLRKPQTEVEKRTPSEDTDRNKRDGQDPTKDTTRTRSPKVDVQRALADQATFDAKHLGPYAPFYEASLDGKKVAITWNADHPAYQRLILDNRDNRAVITAIDFLVWSLAAAELMNADDSTAKLMQKMREDASFNLRQLLTA